ncbi:hypothetical protein PCO31111_05113 [Pandoraea communis]|uniref:Uncharacterized protein n=1 Tax=Pandoraea communis TaxID=2508297 RepID=A0A5E4Z5G2_9BURK|nr:hypothetical protein [Pandoraea communis]VVE56319.1 hypothetical protein PCO31111_05113 [Pandoraea communis]
MATVQSTDDLLKSFLDSDVNAWFVQVQPGIDRDALFVSSLQCKGNPTTFHLLVYPAYPFEQDRKTRSISLSVNDGLEINLLRANVELSGEGQDIAAMEWPVGDEVLEKVAAIAKSRPRLITPNYSGKVVSSDDGTISIVMSPTS